MLRSAGFAFGVLNIDESDFALIAKRMLQGAVPYADIADIKPPLAFLAFVPAAIFHGVSILPVQLLGVLWMLATCLVVAAAARRLTGSDLAATCAAWLTLLAAQCDVPSVSTELLMALPAAGALLFYVRAETGGGLREQALAGLCIGLATLFRQQAGILLGAFGLALLWRAYSEKSARALLRPVALTIGFALPLAATVGVFASIGHLAEFWDWVVGRNLQYAAGGPFSATLLRAAYAIPLCVGSTAVPWALATVETFRPAAVEEGGPPGVGRSSARLGAVLALWLTWIAVCLGGRFYEHYFLQFVAPLALVAAPQAARLVKAWPALTSRRRLATVVAAVLPALILLGYSFGRGLAGKYPEQEPRAREVARWLAQNTAPSERLFIWGHFSPIYYLSGRLPGTRYLTTSVHVGNFDPGQIGDGFDVARFRSDRDVRSTLDDLEAHAVPVFVDTTRSGIHHWDRAPLSAVPRLDEYLRTHYRLVAEVAGSRIYRRSVVTASQQ